MLHGEENMGLGHVSGAKERGRRHSLFPPSRGSQGSRRRVGRLSIAMEMTILCSQQCWYSAPQRRWRQMLQRPGEEECVCFVPANLHCTLPTYFYFSYSTPLWRRRSCPPEKFTASFPFYGSRNMRGTLCYCRGHANMISAQR